MSYSAKAVGAVIRELRDSANPKMSQVQLGEAAGYGTGPGAGVSISRVENGAMRPSDDKLTLIAQALGSTRQKLDALASAKNVELNQASRRAERAEVPVKQRLASVQVTVESRTRLITEKAEAFNAAHDRARDDFFLPFVSVAHKIEGAPPPPDMPIATEATRENPEAAAQHRLAVNSNIISLGLAGAGGVGAGAAVGGAAAYATFTATAMFGTASTGAAISGLSGAALSNATLALLGGGTVAAGGAGIAGGTMVLAGIVAGPAVLLAAGGVAWMVRRNRAKEAELREKLDEAEGQLASTKVGFDALVDTLSRATEILDYVAVHAGHSQQRWSSNLPAADPADGSIRWETLTEPQRAEYQNLITAAASQLGAAGVNAEAYLAARGIELQTVIQTTEETLKQADMALRAAV